MYPKLGVDWRIKGGVDDRFLLSLDSFSEYSLNNLQSNALLLCDGRKSVEQVCGAMNIGSGGFLSFLEGLVKIGAVSMMQSKDDRVVPLVSLSGVNSPYLKEVHLDITSKCNLSCLHCYQEPYLAKGMSEMSTEEVKDVIRRLGEMNVSKLVISGGEPLLRDDLIEIIDYAFSQGIIVPTIFTNGTVNMEVLNQLCDYGKPFTLAVSLEGDIASNNDYIRGEGSFLVIMEAVNLILDKQKCGSRVKLVIDTMTHPLNFERLKRMFVYLSDLGVQRWRISLPRNQGAFIGNAAKLNVDLVKVLYEYEEFIKWYLDKGAYTSSLNIQIESFFRTALIRKKKVSVFTPDSCCCEYKKEALTIKPNGDVTACTAFTNMIIGNIAKETIKDIWFSDRMQTIKRIKVSEVKECVGCEYLYLCGTGCRRTALADHGSVYAKDSSICEIYAFFHKRIIPILANLNLKFQETGKTGGDCK